MGAILLVFVFGFVSRTRFIHATVRTVIIGLGVAAAVVLYDGEGSLIVDLFVYIAAGLGSIVGLRMIERNRRQEWHQRHVIEEQAVALAMARAESERLLLNILPESVSRRLKSGESPIADTFSDASVLFADIVDFTPLATSLTAAEVIALLSGLYSRFDDLVAEHGLEKIKTIGDCYLAVGGLPDPLEDHATRVIGLARAMVTATSPKVHSPICVSGSESTPDRWPEALSGPGASPTTFGATRSIPPLASRRRATRGESMSAKPLGHSRITTSGTSRGGG